MTTSPQGDAPKATGITRIIRAFGYSCAGLVSTFKREAAFRQETVAAAALIPLACFIAPDRTALAMMIASVLLVMMTELLNSAIEAVVDRFGPEHHPLAKHAKDAGSAAVLIALILVAVVWWLALT